MREWTISPQEDSAHCIWMSGASMSKKADVLKKAQELTNRLESPHDPFYFDSHYKVHAIHTGTRSYYCISYYISSKDDENLTKWAKSQTEKHDDYYDDGEKLEELGKISKHSRIMKKISKILPIGASVAVALPIIRIFMIAAPLSWTNFTDIIAGLCAITLISTLGILIYAVAELFCDMLYDNIITKYKYVFTRNGIILDSWNLNHGRRGRHVKEFLTRALSHRGKIRILVDSKKLLRISIAEPHPNIDTTTDEAINILDAAKKEPFEIVKLEDNKITDESIENRSMRIADTRGIVDPEKHTHLEELASLYDDIRNLEAETLAADSISNLMKKKIDALTDEGAIQEMANYPKIVKEFKDVRDRLAMLKNDNTEIHDALKDIDAITLMKSKQ